MDDKDIYARIANLEKYSEIALSHIDNQNKVVDKMQETLGGVNGICVELKTMISIYDKTINDMKGSTDLESNKNDEKYLDLLTKLHEQKLHNIQANSIQDDKHNELMDKIADNIAKLDEKHVKLNDTLDTKHIKQYDKLSDRLVKLEQFRWIVLGVAMIPTIYSAIIKMFPGILS